MNNTTASAAAEGGVSISIDPIADLLSAADFAANIAMAAVEGQSIAAVIRNNTPYNMVRYSGIWEPVHGAYVVSPGQDIPSLLDGASRKDQEGKPAFEEKNNTKYNMKSRGSGTEVVAVYEIKELSLMLAFYIGNPVTGSSYAGVSISDTSWFTGNVNKHSKDHKGNWLRDHIKNIHSEVCKYSRNGQPQTAGRQNGLQVSFASADKVHFNVGFNGSWKEFLPAFNKKMRLV